MAQKLPIVTGISALLQCDQKIKQKGGVAEGQKIQEESRLRTSNHLKLNTKKSFVGTAGFFALAQGRALELWRYSRVFRVNL